MLLFVSDQCIPKPNWFCTCGLKIRNPFRLETSRIIWDERRKKMPYHLCFSLVIGNCSQTGLHRMDLSFLSSAHIHVSITAIRNVCLVINSRFCTIWTMISNLMFATHCFWFWFKKKDLESHDVDVKLLKHKFTESNVHKSPAFSNVVFCLCEWSMNLSTVTNALFDKKELIVSDYLGRKRCQWF